MKILTEEETRKDLERFKNPDEGASKKELFRIFEGIIEISPEQGREAAQHALDHPDLYNGKIVKQARRIIHPPAPKPHESKPMTPVEVAVGRALSGEESRQSLAKVRKGDVLTLTFKRECIEDLLYLEAMTRFCLEHTSLSGPALVYSIMGSGKWERDEDREWKLRATCDFTDGEVSFFIGRMSRPLEKLAITYWR
tara:strand:+ start:388 stop:975 length:588 start_codon:yes stop_codon:yes gene_type:complete